MLLKTFEMVCKLSYIVEKHLSVVISHLVKSVFRNKDGNIFRTVITQKSASSPMIPDICGNKSKQPPKKNLS